MSDQSQTARSGTVESEGLSIAPNEIGIKPVLQEMTIPKEVEAAGVTVTPQSVPLPPQIVQAGVTNVGVNAPVSPVTSHGVQLPLTDDQIAHALQENIKHSIRWLAEWCVRKIKVVHAKVIIKHH